MCEPSDLVVSVELLVLPLTLPEGLPLGLQCLGQVCVLQTFLRVLLRQHLQLPLDGLQLLPRQSDRYYINSETLGLSNERLQIGLESSKSVQKMYLSLYFFFLKFFIK